MKKLILFIALAIVSIPAFSQSRNTAIELHIDTTKITKVDLDSLVFNYDVEYSSKESEYILWVHLDSTYMPFDRKAFKHISALKKAYNRKTKTDHLNLYLEADTIDLYGLEKDSIKYKNIRASELHKTDITKVKLKKEL